VTALGAALATAGVYSALLVLLAVADRAADHVDLPRPAVAVLGAITAPAWVPIWLGGRAAEWLARRLA
jgi:hypothetical protein